MYPDTLLQHSACTTKSSALHCRPHAHSIDLSLVGGIRYRSRRATSQCACLMRYSLLLGRHSSHRRLPFKVSILACTTVLGPSIADCVSHVIRSVCMNFCARSCCDEVPWIPLTPFRQASYAIGANLTKDTDARRSLVNSGLANKRSFSAGSLPMSVARHFSARSSTDQGQQPSSLIVFPLPLRGQSAPRVPTPRVCCTE